MQNCPDSQNAEKFFPLTGNKIFRIFVSFKSELLSPVNRFLVIGWDVTYVKQQSD